MSDIQRKVPHSDRLKIKAKQKLLSGIPERDISEFNKYDVCYYSATLL